MSLVTEVLRQIGLVELRKDGRCPALGLEVRYRVGTEEKEFPIRDISATGIFVLTRERLQIGSCTYFTLGRKRSMASGCSPGVRLRVKAVRQNEEGIGLSFEPYSPGAGSWLELMAMAAMVGGSGDAVERFRIAKALSFLGSIAAPLHSKIADLMHSSMLRQRQERVVAMILAAEEHLEQRKRLHRDQVSPDLIGQILLLGSTAEDRRTQSFWEQLLISSCLTAHEEAESLQLADILSKLLPIDLELFCAACEMAMAGWWSDSGKIYCSALQLRAIAHTPSLIMIEQHLHHLYDLGLLEQTIKPFQGDQIGEGNLTVTPLGIELYARCCDLPIANT